MQTIYKNRSLVIQMVLPTMQMKYFNFEGWICKMQLNKHFVCFCKMLIKIHGCFFAGTPSPNSFSRRLFLSTRRGNARLRPRNLLRFSLIFPLFVSPSGLRDPQTSCFMVTVPLLWWVNHSYRVSSWSPTFLFLPLHLLLVAVLAVSFLLTNMPWADFKCSSSCWCTIVLRTMRRAWKTGAFPHERSFERYVNCGSRSLGMITAECIKGVSFLVGGSFVFWPFLHRFVDWKVFYSGIVFRILILITEREVRSWFVLWGKKRSDWYA